MSELLRDGKLLRLTEKRNNGSVHVLPEHLADREQEPYVSTAERHRNIGYNEGHNDGFSLGLETAFREVDGADSLGEALIVLRRMIEASK
uniref:Uncharacterized protein n=2 Tax=unclassified bacterial viruses TaxID=12333 RepID=A0AAU7J7S3_9VIRU